MRRLAIAVVAMLVCRGALADDPPAPLKPGVGRDIVSVQCDVCHTSDYIVMNSMFLTAGAWQAEVAKMRSVFGAPIDDAAAARIVAYLAAYYAVPAKP